MSSSAKLAIVAALEREVRPLVKRWHVSPREHAGHQYRFFEHAHCVLVCGGIGEHAARRATEAVISLYCPSLVISAGFAGALDPSLPVGAVVRPGRVMDVRDGSVTETNTGEGMLVSLAGVAGPEQKTRLANAYGARAVDMEAAGVARAAGARGVAFEALKAISDELDFAMPAMEKFIGGDGQFDATAFAVFTALRPWMWRSVLRLARNSSLASKMLCRELEAFIEGYVESDPSREIVDKLEKAKPGLHLTTHTSLHLQSQNMETTGK